MIDIFSETLEQPMPFVFEDIDSPAKQEKADAFARLSPFSRGRADLKKWLVDPEQGLYFLNLSGGGPDSPYYLVLADADGTALLQARGLQSVSGPYRPKSVDVVWDIDSITIAAHARGQEEHLLARLREALDAYGSFGNPEVTRSVRANLPAPIVR